MSIGTWVYAFLFLFLCSEALAAFTPSKLLEVHYINVGQGQSTLIIGPDGTRILYDFGKDGRGGLIATYLSTIGITSTDGLQYTILSHRDSDHYGGYKGVTSAGYNVEIANFDSGSNKPATKKMRRVWIDPASKTNAGPIRSIPVGLKIAIGDGAVLFIAAANGKVFRNSSTPVAVNENDKSVAVLLKYKNFEMILDGDLGAGPESCTSHKTQQRDFQSHVASMLVEQGWISKVEGVDVLHVSHHGSESSTSAKYFNLMKPEIGIIGVGIDQGRFLHPRADVVDQVLLQIGPDVPACVEADPVLRVFQTADGKSGTSSTGSTSFAGTSIGNVKLVTDGISNYVITGDQVEDGVTQPEGGWCFAIQPGGACSVGPSD